MRKLWITGCIAMICMGMLTACGGNKTEVVPIEDTEEAEREVPYAMYINRCLLYTSFGKACQRG